MAITQDQLDQAKPEEKQRKLFDGRGLFLLVSPTGGKLWRLAYRFGGKQKTLALGQYPDVSLAMARERREEARRLLANGVDPSEAKSEEKKARNRQRNEIRAIKKHKSEALSALKAQFDKQLPVKEQSFQPAERSVSSQRLPPWISESTDEEALITEFEAMFFEKLHPYFRLAFFETLEAMRRA